MRDNKINTQQLLYILICSTIGAGIFIAPSDLMKETNSKPLYLLCWILSYFIVIMFGLCYAELGSTFPYEGGDARYLNIGYGSMMCNIYSFISVCVILPCSCSMMINSICQSTGCAIFIQKIFMFIGILLLGFLNWHGNKYVYKMQYVLTILKLIVLSMLVFLSVLVFFNVIKVKEKVDTFLLPNKTEKFSFSDSFNTKNIMKVLNGMLLVLWTYDGWNSGNFIAHSVSNPGRSFPISITISSTIVCIIYLLINLSYFKVLSIEKMKDNELIKNYFSNLDIPEWTRKVMGACLNIIPSLGTLVGSFMVGTSIIDSFISKYLSKKDLSLLSSEEESFNLSEDTENGRYYDPKTLKLIGLGTFSFLVFILTFFETSSVLRTVIFLIYFFYGLSLGVIIKMRKKDKNIHRPFKVSKFIIYPCIGLSITIGIVTIYKRIYEIIN